MAVSWRDIPTYEGLYQISNEGEVRSLQGISKRKNILTGGYSYRKGKVLTPDVSTGYKRVKLCKYDNGKWWCVHKLLYCIEHNLNIHADLKIDHKDRNKLNNSLDNLRLATSQENNRNIGKRTDNCSSIYKGVSFSKNNKKNPWRAGIRIGKKCIHLGYFNNEKDAAEAYDKKALELFKDFAYLNKNLLEAI